MRISGGRNALGRRGLGRTTKRIRPRLQTNFDPISAIS
jgi:hypothetical protein